jgi:hypothetical protein
MSDMSDLAKSTNFAMYRGNIGDWAQPNWAHNHILDLINHSTVGYWEYVPKFTEVCPVM